MVVAAWLLFISASLLLIATPGQDMILVMSCSVSQGPRAGVVTAAGVSVGLVGHTILATLGCRVAQARMTRSLPGKDVPRPNQPLLSAELF